jgi:hypothetical protein
MSRTKGLAKSLFKVQNWSEGKYSALSSDVLAVVHHQVIPQGQSVNHFHTECPWEAIRHNLRSSAVEIGISTTTLLLLTPLESSGISDQ